MRTIKMALGLASLLSLLLVGCNSDAGDVIGSGSFEAREVLISSEVSGKVLQWHAEEGSVLEAGEIVGVIDTMQLYFQKEALLRSGKGVSIARPDVAQQTAALEVQLKDLETEQKRLERLLDAGAVTQQKLDQIETSIATLRSQLVATRSQLGKSSAQLTAQSSSIDVQVAQVEDLIARSRITAPIAGTVIGNYVEEGELAGAGQPLLRLADLSHIYLRAYVTAERLAELKLGDEVKVYIDGTKEGGEKSYVGKITWISSVAEFAPKSVQTRSERAAQVYAIKVAVQNDGYIRIGMYGEVRG